VHPSWPRRILDFVGARSTAALLVAALGLCWLYWFGYQYGTSNTLEQATFVKRHHDPTYLQGDFVVDSANSRQARYFYTLVLAGVSQWTTIQSAHFALYLVCLAAFILATYFFAWQMFPSRLAAGCTTFLAVCAVGYTLDANQLWREFMQPSSLAVPLAVAGFALAARGRQLAALLVLGVTTLVHLLIGAELAALLLLAELYRRVRERKPLRPVYTTGAAYLLLALPALVPMAIGQVQLSSERLTTEELLLALATFRAPWHYRPFLWNPKDYHHFFALLLLGLSFRASLSSPDRATRSAFWASIPPLGLGLVLLWGVLGFGPSATDRASSVRLLTAGTLAALAIAVWESALSGARTQWPLLAEEAQAAPAEARRRLDRWMAGILLFCFVGTVFVELLPVGLVIKAQFFRLTIFLKLFLLVYLGRALAAMLRSPHLIENVAAPLLCYALLARHVDAGLGLATAVLAFNRLRCGRDGIRPGLAALLCWIMLGSWTLLLWQAGVEEKSAYLAAVVAVVALVIRALGLLPATGRRAVTAASPYVAVALAVVLVVVQPPRINRVAGRVRAHAAAHARVDPALSQLVRYSRKHTKPGDVFLIPPNLEQFRQLAARPVVVDFKLVPFDMAGLKEWWERINAVTREAPRRRVEAGDRRAPGYMDRIRTIKRGYSRLRSEDVIEIGRRYGARFMVAAGQQRMPFPEMFRNRRFTLYRIPGPPKADDET